ncbi:MULTISPECIES: RNA methyltransferase [unclassified Bacteroides]|jgi:TrmH family RNA methyltransferase|uniref:TrmH family RNA methyltransferase n=1 Tax=unclassified Bacteroides TaxID=2646097 RepID=UPI000E93796F|nr:MULTISPECIES: RNA methyltransferase [unclassified Bacteroides]RGN48639.1 RNA methyltransferase [Bacteroides sp. OM05-12]RHR75602.1 RNA methyltransferase [Bacteroides sp. AF16-49]
MLSKNKIKYIHSLELKKNRKAEHVFVAEGHKTVGDLLGHFPCKLLIATKEWFDKKLSFQADEIIEVNNDDLFKASFLKTPQEVLAVFEQPEYTTDATVVSQSLCLALDDVQDPGNLGTIIRLADWFGIEHIFCSNNTVDAFNPKTIQATMGAIARVKLHYCSLYELISNLKDVPVYGTFLDGEDIYTQKLSSNGLIIMGNEGNGISQEVEQLINKRLYIPNYPQSRETSESLNVAIATAIVCSEFRRQAL